MRIILDTNILWDPAAVRSAGAQRTEVVLPVVAFLERARQIQQAGRPLAELWKLLAAAGAEVEGLEVAHGLRIVPKLDRHTWDRHARDALIAGHVGPGDVLWTKNPKDFEAVGLSPAQIVAV